MQVLSTGSHELESEVRVYNRMFPVCFDRAEGHTIWDNQDRSYIDFLSSAGSLNYGHNPSGIKEKVIKYLQFNGVTTSLDMMTTAKYQFIERFKQLILQPRSLDYKIQFTGPTGTNAVEAALKIARLKTGRQTVVCFTNAFHGVSTGSLSITGNRSKRLAAQGMLNGTFRLPFEGYIDNLDTPALLEQMLDDPSSGLDLPAAIILETIQAEGGVKVASIDWLRRIADIAHRHNIPLIVDDIQTGCGRTGRFFSFEEAGIVPDIVCLSKSLGAMGLPIAIVLMRPDMDVWEAGQHNGTFRGNNLAFVAATAALETYWSTNEFEENTVALSLQIGNFLKELRNNSPSNDWIYRGRGLIWGIEWQDKKKAELVSKRCFEKGLIIETCGAWDQVLKILPPLNITPSGLNHGLEILANVIANWNNECQ